MCGRFTLRTARVQLAAHLDLEVPEWVRSSFNIAPSQAIAAVRETRGQWEWAPLKWGLLPSWSKESSTRYSTINARAETVASKPAYRGPFQRRRCLVPADGFYEWRASGKLKQPYFIHRMDDAPFVFAGLWDRWQQAGQLIESVAIIVTEANALMAPIHARMPVILDPGSYARWMDHRQFDRAALEALLKPYPDGVLEAYAVSRRVNSPAHDEADCIEPQADLLD